MWATFVAFVLAVVAAIVVRKWAKLRQEATGQQFPAMWAGLAILIVLPSLVFLATGSPMTWDVPSLQGFNFRAAPGCRRPSWRCWWRW